MWGVIGRVCVAVWMGCFTVAAAQLPPDVMVDKYLLEAKLLSEEKNHKGALEAMDRIVALQKEHDLTLPEAFPFQYAQTALAADAVQATIDSANRYLTAAGREGKYYREALELLVKAERRLQEPAADRVGSTPVKPDLEPQPQAVPPSSLQAQKMTKAQPEPDCRQWNTRKYFQKATVEIVTACLAAGADLKALDDGNRTPLHYAAMYSNPAVIETLLKAGADARAVKWTPLHRAALFSKDPAEINTLVKAGANLEARDKWKNTPLHWAARYNENPAVIETLLKAGADPMARDKWKYTPLHWAARHNENPAVIETLLKAALCGPVKAPTRRRGISGKTRPCIGRPGITRIRRSSRLCSRPAPTRRRGISGNTCPCIGRPGTTRIRRSSRPCSRPAPTRRRGISGNTRPCIRRPGTTRIRR